MPAISRNLSAKPKRARCSGALPPSVTASDRVLIIGILSNTKRQPPFPLCTHCVSFTNSRPLFFEANCWRIGRGNYETTVEPEAHTALKAGSSMRDRITDLAARTNAMVAVSEPACHLKREQPSGFTRNRLCGCPCLASPLHPLLHRQIRPIHKTGGDVRSRRCPTAWAPSCILTQIFRDLFGTKDSDTIMASYV